MKFTPDPHKAPLLFRLLALVVAAGLALTLLQIGVAGVRFMRLLGKVSSQIAQSEAPPAKPRILPETSVTPGIVAVQLLPPAPRSP